MDDLKRVKTAIEASKLFVLKHPDLMAVPMIRMLDEAVLLLNGRIYAGELTRTEPGE